ncbi:MAG: sigma 54-interacting transcriptional regulator [Thermoanaerobacteraceae bacterium]|nr:sigma 54-interacting transcriptional regulator [Thermoanaerobacteraceae bacterium]
MTVVSQGENTLRILISQIRDLIGDSIEIKGLSVEKGIPDIVRDDLVLISSDAVYDAAVGHIEAGTPFIVARRAVNYKELGGIFTIPPGSRVLLVNDLERSTMETIELLRNLGFGYLDFIPYWPGYEVDKEYDYVVTPGEPQLVPYGIESFIDIGVRTLDLSTIYEILEHFNLLNIKSNMISVKYISDIIELTKEAKYYADIQKRVKEQLETILNSIDEGVVAADKNGKIKLVNPRAEEFIGLVSNSNITIGKIAAKYGIKGGLADAGIYNINNRELVVTKKDMGQDYLYVIKDVSEVRELERKLRLKLTEHGNIARYSTTDIIMESRGMSKTVNLAKKIAKSDSTVLITGESGTGKELLAQAIHNLSKRKDMPFVAVNFASIPSNLLESELFGYEEGAFTGARKGGKIGLFEEAHGGTIFLDEIGDAPMELQARLLRVLQERQIRKVGGTKVIPINVRVMAATNKDLAKLVEDGRFREDLYYRLNVLPVRIPPLRERVEDIIPLMRYFMKKQGRQLKISEEAMKFFEEYSWPGNVRELENVVEYLCTVKEDELVRIDDIPQYTGSLGVRNIDIDNRLNRESIYADSIRILNFLKERPMGRRTLYKELSDSGIQISEYRLRHIIDRLKNMGLIEINKGIEGTKITGKGLEYLETKL